MTGGGDLDEVRDDEDGLGGGAPGQDPGHEVDAADDGLLKPAQDLDPTAGASDIGGRAGDPDS
jgi:hypothetical protein